MQITFDLIDIILLIAAAQGVLMGVLMLHKYARLTAVRFLGTLMLIYSFILFYLTFAGPAFYVSHPWLMGFLSGLPFLAGPLHFLYAKYLITNKHHVDYRDLYHLIYFPVYLIVVFIYEWLTVPAVDAELNEMSLRFVIFNWVLLFQAFTYIGSTLIILQRYARNIKFVFANLEKIKMDWLRNITLVFSLGLMVFLLENALLLFNINLSNYFDLSSIVAAVMFYILGYLGLLKTEIFAEPSIAESIGQLSSISGDQEGREKYSKSGLTPEKGKTYYEKLLQVMEQKKLYTDSTLTLNKLAEQAGISAHNLSEVINLHSHLNFFDFINQYRVEMVKNELTNPQNKNLTFLAIALNAGFNSKSSFNTIFKKHTGMTPSEYHRNNNNPK